MQAVRRSASASRTHSTVSPSDRRTRSLRVPSAATLWRAMELPRGLKDSASCSRRPRGRSVIRSKEEARPARSQRRTWRARRGGCPRAWSQARSSSSGWLRNPGSGPGTNNGRSITAIVEGGRGAWEGTRAPAVDLPLGRWVGIMTWGPLAGPPRGRPPCLPGHLPSRATMSEPVFRPGLADVPVAESAISFIDGKRARLEYRGLAVEALARESCFEETCWLLLKGELPTQRELADFRRELRQHRRLKYKLLDLLK